VNKSTPSQRWILVLSSAAVFMVGLDVLVVTTALTTIKRQLGASLGELDWIVTAYTLSFAVLLMTAAALGDRYGRRRLLVTGLVVFTAASAVCALVPGVGLLIVARAVQGAGAAMIMPHAMTLLSAAYPPERRARALGIFSGFVGLAILSGPILGGAITQELSWRWIFWLNVPVGLVTAVLARSRVAEHPRTGARLDVPGLVLVTAAASGLVWGLVRGNEAGWGSAQVVGPLAGGAVLAAAFTAWELRAAAPMLPMRFFRIRAFAAGNAVCFLFTAALFGAVFFIAQFLQTTMHYTPLGTGVRMLPWTIMLSLIAPAAGALADRLGNRPLILAGLIMQGAGFGLIAVLARAGSGYPALIGPMILAGAGASVAMPAMQNAPISAVPPAAIGKASGTYNTLRQLGATFGIAIGSAVFAAAGGLGTAGAFSRGFSAAMWVCAGLCGAAMLIALAIPGRRPAPRPQTAAAVPSSPDESRDESLVR
jgi:EmrB/QacA subfamily drug resistance transporter